MSLAPAAGTLTARLTGLVDEVGVTATVYCEALIAVTAPALPLTTAMSLASKPVTASLKLTL